MSRYVDIDLIERELNENGFYELDKIPKVDAVSVVRCKDCKFLTDGKCFFTTTPKDPDDYCSLGEKVTKCGMKKFFVLSRRSPEYHRIVEAKDISEVADHCYDCYGIIEISPDEVTK